MLVSQWRLGQMNTVANFTRDTIKRVPDLLELCRRRVLVCLHVLSSKQIPVTNDDNGKQSLDV